MGPPVGWRHGTTVKPTPAYSARHLDSERAAAYRRKFERSFTRRMSARREHTLVERALTGALARVASETPVLLDYPCGAGRFAPLLASRADRYVAGDHSPHMLEITRTVLEQAGLQHKLVRTTEGDARAMELEDDAVDLAVCIRLLHHFREREDRVRVLAELARVSRGPLVTSFLDGESFKQRRYAARRTRQGKPLTRVLQTRDEFAAEAGEAGWVVVDSWALSSLFSGQRVVLLDHAEARA